LKVHLARLSDLEYLTQVGSGPATTYALRTEDTAYGTHRPDSEGYRPGQNDDQPGVGRFFGGDGKPFPTWEDTEYDSDRPGIGRVPQIGEKATPTREDTGYETDRPGFSQIRVLGKENCDGVGLDREAVR
jgi:hypothetical protein